MPAGGIVVRDRAAAAMAGRYDVCYVNGFQTQAWEKRFWRRHWHLVLKQGGEAVFDREWGDLLLDIRTTSKRATLGRIVGRWMVRCAEEAYAAVELTTSTRCRAAAT